jgi:hypothetical protein
MKRRKCDAACRHPPRRLSRTWRAAHSPWVGRAPFRQSSCSGAPTRGGSGGSSSSRSREGRTGGTTLTRTRRTSRRSWRCGGHAGQRAGPVRPLAERLAGWPLSPRPLLQGCAWRRGCFAPFFSEGALNGSRSHQQQTLRLSTLSPAQLHRHICCVPSGPCPHVLCPSSLRCVNAPTGPLL